MLIRKVKLQNFKKFREQLEVDFSPGVNVVKGPLNESGKSTLLEGMLTAIFEDPTSNKKGLEKLWTWGAGSKGKISIELESGGVQYLLEKDFNKKTLCLADGKDRWDTKRQVSEKLHQLLGTDSRDIFLSTSCIKQDELRDIESGKEELSRNLEKIVTGSPGGVTATDIVRRLDEEISWLKKGLEKPTKEPGPIARVQEQIEKQEQRLNEIREKVEEIERLKRELPDVERQLSQVIEELNMCQTLLDKNKELRDIEREIARLKKDFDSINKLDSDIRSLEGEIKRLRRELQGIPGFDSGERITEIKKGLEELDMKRRDKSGDLAKIRQELSSKEEYLRKRGLVLVMASKGMLIAGAIVTVLGFAAMLINSAAAAAGGIGIILVIVSLWARSYIATSITEKRGLEKRIEQMENALDNLKQEEVQTLLRIQCNSREEFDHKYRYFEQLTQDLKDCQTKRDAMLGGQTAEQIEEQKNKLAGELAVAEKRLTPELENTRLSAEDFVKYERRKRESEEAQERLKSKKLELELKIKTAPYDAEELSQTEEKLQDMREELEQWKRKLAIYELAKKFILQARNETLTAIHDELKTKVENNLSTFTDGRYKEVELKQANLLGFTIYSREKGALVEPEELSGGTIDQFYLACRLALAQVIYRDKQPPLILDDPLYNFDNIRLQRALNSLKEIGKNQQVIIFTLGDTYDTIADRMIELPQG